MKQNREYTDYLKDISDAIEKVQQFVEGMDFEKFSHDSKTVFAVKGKWTCSILIDKPEAALRYSCIIMGRRLIKSA